MKTRPLSSRAVCTLAGLALLVESALAGAQPTVQHSTPRPDPAPAAVHATTSSAQTPAPTWEVAAETYAFVFGLGLVGYGLFFRRQVKQRF